MHISLGSGREVFGGMRAARRHNREPEHEDREQPAVQVGGEGAADVDVALGPCCGRTKRK